MASDAQRDLKKDLLRKDKLELVKILKAKKQPTNGTKGDLVDRILANDEKTGGKMARKASKAVAGGEDDDDEEEEYDEYDEEDDEDLPDYEEEEAPPKKKKKKKKKKKNTSSGGTGGGGGGGGGSQIDCNCSPNIECGGGFIGIAQIATCIAAVGQLILGIIQFILLAEALQVCDPDIYDGCVGESLFWELGNDETASFNFQWRTVFTFRPSLFFANWTPMLFGLIAMMQMFYSTQWYFVSGTWVRCLFFHLVMILFAALPYCGKAGIVIGFIQVFAGFMCFVMCFVDRGGGGTYFSMSF